MEAQVATRDWVQSFMQEIQFLIETKLVSLQDRVSVRIQKVEENVKKEVAELEMKMKLNTGTEVDDLKIEVKKSEVYLKKVSAVTESETQMLVDVEDLRKTETQLPDMLALRDQIRRELCESQQRFASEVERRLEEAIDADAGLLRDLSRKSSLPSDRSGFLPEWGMQYGSTSKDGYEPLSTMVQIETENTKKELTEEQNKWIELWLEEAEGGELDVYTCLGLSNCCTCTHDTRKIMAKACAVTLMQMLVPAYLLRSELHEGIEVGPAVGDLGFRMVGATLYGYAIYSMFLGASDHCRTALLNVMFRYPDIPAGMWIPLAMGELSNVFTAVVLAFALYSIFTTQTAAADLILNAVAVNFLGDCDSGFVNGDMRADAIATFKDFSRNLFTRPGYQVEDPDTPSRTLRVVNVLMSFIPLLGVFGCATFLLFSEHKGGKRDMQPGFGRDIVDFKMINGTMVPTQVGNYPMGNYPMPN